MYICFKHTLIAIVYPYTLDCKVKKKTLNKL